MPTPVSKMGTHRWLGRKRAHCHRLRSHHLPAGKGALAFRDAAEAAEGIAQVSSDYPAHAQAARKMAVEFFEAKKVCQDLLRAA